MSSSEPQKPLRRSAVNPSQPGLGAPSDAGKPFTAPSQGSDSTAQSGKVDTLVTGDPKVGTQPQSQVGPAPQFKSLGRYTILGELGRGGMGAVYLAEDTVLTRKVALKIPQFEPRKEEQMRARFIREAQLAAQLTHPHICQIYDVGVIDGQLVMAMEYIEGRNLAAFTKPDKLMSARAAVGLVKKIALAVDVAHQKGLVHRDLKPSNIMLSQPDKSKKTIEPKVMDFGLAKSLESTGKQLTHSGMIVGTPCYMSKEQWSGREGQLGPASDVFGLGVILYELLTGQLPYDSDDGEPATAWFVKLVTQPQFLPSERKPGVDSGLEAIVMRSIAKEPEDRYIKGVVSLDCANG
jgi:serine/threonine protein kinase